MKKVEINENILWDLIRKKQTVDAVLDWMRENEVMLRNMRMLTSLRKILYAGGSEEAE